MIQLLLILLTFLWQVSCGLPAIEHIRVIGMQNSGTNYIKEILRKYFDANATASENKVVHLYDVREGFIAGKHGLQDYTDVNEQMWTWNLPDYSNTLVIAITRNPLDQAISWHKEHSKGRFRKKLLLQKYCTGECDYRQRKKCCYKNIFAWRTEYLKMLLRTEQWASNMVFVRHEDVMCRSKAVKFVIGLKRKYTLYSTGLPVNDDTVRFEFHRGIQRSKGRIVTFDSLLRRSYYYNLGSHRALQEYIQRYVRNMIDFNLEKRFGYLENPQKDSGRFCS